LALSLEVTLSRGILREVTPHGVRVYSLCASCGAHLAASATLCDACARSRSAPNS
jgi:predicted amidophosphoribosyltransferase